MYVISPQKKPDLSEIFQISSFATFQNIQARHFPKFDFPKYKIRIPAANPGKATFRGQAPKTRGKTGKYTLKGNKFPRLARRGGVNYYFKVTTCGTST